MSKLYVLVVERGHVFAGSKKAWVGPFREGDAVSSSTWTVLAFNLYERMVEGSKKT